jgi:hypothetical protein
VEILDASGNPCPAGVSGEVTVTRGDNALLRYRTGDHAALDWVAGEPVLVGLDGREPVLFRAENGRWVNSIEFTHLLSPRRNRPSLKPRCGAWWVGFRSTSVRPTCPAMPSRSATRRISMKACSGDDPDRPEV